jgi:Protein of unknown function (DUF2490)
MRRFASALILFLAGALATSAQTPTPTPVDDTDVQSWNDISISKAIHDKVDVVVPLTFRFGKNISRLNEGRIGIGLAFKPHSRVTISPTYLYIKSRNSAGRFATENRVTAGITYKFPVKVVGVSHRSIFEFRFRPNRYTWRYRPSITVEKQLPEKWAKGLKAYVTEDPFYDSAAGRFSRNRLTFGINKTLNKHLSLDLYYLRQDDRNSDLKHVHVLGTGWKIKL